MKKYLMLAFVPLFFGCASHEPAATEPEIDSCACAYEPDPAREVKHPRVLEEVVAPSSRRSCDDHQTMDCGCGQCDAFHVKHIEMVENSEMQGEVPSEPALPKPATYVPAQPQAYVLLANRAFNRFIKDTYDIYKEQPNLKIYVAEPVLKSADLPAGFEKGINTFKTQLQNSHAFQLTDDSGEADYTVSTTIDWFDTPSKDVPAIRYMVSLYAKDKTDAGTWSHVVKKADNKSWL